MHVQLVNDGENKQNKLKIQSLCFYYRNHKHVLYGSFTINEDVFIFSFNIFDIYRSYQSRSNKKSSKSHKSSKSTSSKTASTGIAINDSKAHQQQLQTQQSLDSGQDGVKKQQPDSHIDLTNPALKILETQLSDETQDESQQQQQQKQNLESISPEIAPSLTTTGSSIAATSKQDPKPIQINKNNWTLPPSSAVSNAATNNHNVNTLNNLLFNAFNSITSNVSDNSLLFTKALEQQTSSANALSNCNICPPAGFSFTSTTPAVFNPNIKQRQPQIQNLSNFLIVRFEIGANHETTSKSKGKYKKSIKISVSAKVLPTNNSESNGSDNASTSNDFMTVPLTQKAFEFTEKCLSFRLACIDNANDANIRRDFNVKLINLYDKSLFAIVNFTINNADKDLLGYKLYQIKHEENSSSTATTTTTTTAVQSNPSKQQQQQQTSEVTTTTTIPSQATVLSATSSSRLNLTELTISNLNFDCNILSLIAISVTTYEDDPDIRLIAMLDYNGLISIVDPFKNIKMYEFKSPSSEEKFISISYCYGIDKICAISELGKAYLICVRVSPIVNPINLNEIYSLIANDGVGDGTITLPKLVVDSNPLKSDVNACFLLAI